MRGITPALLLLLLVSGGVPATGAESKAFHRPTLVQFRHTNDDLARQGYRPICDSDDVVTWRASGIEVGSLRGFDDAVQSYMKERDIARGSLAVTYRGRLVLARGYTWAPANEAETSPRSLFRIASVSKPLTAVGILRLVESKRLDLEQRIVPLLKLVGPIDPRWEDVTVRQLLIHRGGWDRAASFDPMFADFRIGKERGRPLPTTPDSIINFMTGVKLDFDPGSRYAYSNFGYCLLGRVIERVTNQPYGDYTRAEVLRPLGVTGMRLARSLRENAALDEVDYVDSLGAKTRNVMGEGADRVPRPYGGFNIESMDAHGGWIGSAIDLVRFAASFDRPDEHPVLSRETIDRMWSRPSEVPADEASFNAMGWWVRGVGDDLDAWHTGSLPGTWALLVHRHEGINWMAAFNRRSEGTMPDSGAIDPALHRAADAVTEWPEHDLFEDPEVPPNPTR